MTVSHEATETGRATRPASIKVWDPFVRLFHWSLVSFFTIAWITADEWDRIHEIMGYAVAVLVGLRIIWSIVGTRHARFSDFIYRPSTVIGYLKDSLHMKARRYLGHNPAGGTMVVVLLLCLVAVSATGFMLTMDAYWMVEWVEELHEAAANLTLALVVVHVGGVIFSSVEHKENLVRSMITGLKRRDD